MELIEKITKITIELEGDEIEALKNILDGYKDSKYYSFADNLYSILDDI